MVHTESLPSAGSRGEQRGTTTRGRGSVAPADRCQSQGGLRVPVEHQERGPQPNEGDAQLHVDANQELPAARQAKDLSQSS